MPIMIVLLLTALSCRKNKKFNQSVRDCDTISNYYEDSTHYINKEFLTEEGVLDYGKLMKQYDSRHSFCNPKKTLDRK
ncbi:MAG: hypothetical protein H7A25_22580 [Leptospiraceae bacterium]|nr:hypothetical protein [Leptospiraceae bacterium]